MILSYLISVFAGAFLYHYIMGLDWANSPVESAWASVTMTVIWTAMTYLAAAEGCGIVKEQARKEARKEAREEAREAREEEVPPEKFEEAYKPL